MNASLGRISGSARIGITASGTVSVGTRRPTELTHYTNLDGLRGIIESKALWASSAKFMNDAAELSHGLEIAESLVKGLSLNVSQDTVLKDVLGDLRKNPPQTFLTCFCTKNDLLSQWRGYGGTQGVSITFEAAKLSDMVESYKGSLAEVLYGDDKSERIRAAIRAHFENLPNKPFVGGSSLGKDELRALLAGLLPQLKHDGFSEEKEWRFVVQRLHASPSLLRHRVRGNVVLPYLELTPSGSLSELPIKAVTVGPGKNPALTRESLEIYLREKGLAVVPVAASQVPYRE